MKSKKSGISSTIFLFVALVLGIVSILCIFFPGAVHESNLGNTSVALSGLVFGNPIFQITVAAGSTSGTTQMQYTGGISWFALSAFILVALGLLLFLFGLIFRRKRTLLAVLGALVIIAGASLMLGVLQAGQDLIVASGTAVQTPVAFKDALGNYSLGYGTILYFVFGLISGVTGLFSLIFKR